MRLFITQFWFSPFHPPQKTLLQILYRTGLLPSAKYIMFVLVNIHFIIILIAHEVSSR